MLTREAFISQFGTGVHLLDGATGTVLIAAGMPRGCCTEAWILEHPQVIKDLQRAYAEAAARLFMLPPSERSLWCWLLMGLPIRRKRSIVS